MSKSIRVKLFSAVCAALALLMAASAACMPQTALAYSAPTYWDDLSTTGYRPADGIPSLFSAYNNLRIDNVSIVSGADEWGLVDSSTAEKSLVHKARITSKGKQKLGPVTLRCSDSARTVDGKLLYVDITYTPSVYISASSAWGKNDILRIGYFHYNSTTKAVVRIGLFSALHTALSASESTVDSNAVASVRNAVKVELRDRDTGQLYDMPGRCAYYRFDDLDVRTSGWNAAGTTKKSSYTDFTNIGDGTCYNEGVQFTSGVQSINVQKKRYLTISDDNSKYVAGAAPSGTTRNSIPEDAVAVKADTKGFSFTWQGVDCGTAILGVGDYVHYRLVVKKASSDFGYTQSRAGAVYGVYSDKACVKQLYTATCDADGTAYVLEDGRALVYDTTYYLKEITAAPGYALDTTVYPFDAKNTYSYVTKGSATYDDLTVNVKDDPLRYKVTTSVRNGFIDPTATGLNWGTDKTVSYAPKSGYKLRSVTVDGVSVSTEDSASSHTFTDIRQDHTVLVVYEPVLVPFSFTKVAQDGTTALAGAAFSLYSCTDSGHGAPEDHSETADGAAGCCWNVAAARATATSGEGGLVDFGELGRGQYMLVETQAPDGYRLPYGQWLVDVDAVACSVSISARGDDPTPVLEKGRGSGNYALVNYREWAMPRAGGEGLDGLLSLAGGALVGMACLWALAFWMREKRRAPRAAFGPSRASLGFAQTFVFGRALQDAVGEDIGELRACARGLCAWPTRLRMWASRAHAMRRRARVFRPAHRETCRTMFRPPRLRASRAMSRAPRAAFRPPWRF